VAPARSDSSPPPLFGGNVDYEQGYVVGVEVERCDPVLKIEGFGVVS